MSKYAHSPYREQYNNNLNTNNNNDLTQRGNQRILQRQPTLPIMLRNDVSPRFSVSPYRQHESSNSRWLPNIDQPQQQQKQPNVSPNNISNKSCSECQQRLFQERVLIQRINDLQTQNQILQNELEKANKQMLQYAKQQDQNKIEVEQLKKNSEQQSREPVYQRYRQFQQPDLQYKEPRSKSDNRSFPQNQQQQAQKCFKLFTCKLDERKIESYYQNQQIHKINFIYGKQDPQWECLISNGTVQQNGFNYIQIQRKSQQDECYLLKGKINNESFSSQDEAAQSILPQLMAKYFLNIFYKDLRNRCTNNIPQFIYPELFILQEIDKQQYWIAEKKYKEPYTQYNTRHGQICQTSNIENLNFLTAFSFFTYYTTYGNYMILDIQGYGQNLTEPNINSSTQKFNNDQGIDKIKKFLVKFQELKLGYKYLDALQINYIK